MTPILNDTIMLRLRGSLDVCQASQLRSWLLDQIADFVEDGLPPAIALDLSQVTQITPAALAAMGEGQACAHRAGGRLLVCGANGPVRQAILAAEGTLLMPFVADEICARLLKAGFEHHSAP